VRQEKSPPGAFCRAGRVFLTRFVVSAGKKEAALGSSVQMPQKIEQKIGKMKGCKIRRQGL